MTPALRRWLSRALLATALVACVPPALAGWPPRWPLADGWELAPSASLQYDTLWGDGDVGLDHADGFRRQRVALTLQSPGGAKLRIDYDLASGSWADTALRLPLGDRDSLRIGQFKVPLGLETLTSHRAIGHLERSPMAAMVPPRRTGIDWLHARAAGTIAIAVVGDSLDGTSPGHALFARSTWQRGTDPDATRVHLGVAGGLDFPRGPLRLRGRPEISGALGTTLADSGAFADVDRIDRLGVEFAVDRGPWHLQGEHLALRARTPLGERDGDGSYLAFGWRPTGEARGYRDGVFDAVQPAHRFGALELVARVSRLQLDRVDGSRSDGHSASLGLNWYLNAHLRLQAQVADGDSADDSAGRSRALRLHWLF